MQRDGDTTNNHSPTLRLTVAQAAEALGTTAEAVRQRIRRGTVTAEKDENGNVFVFLPDDGTYTDHTRTDSDHTSTVSEHTDNNTPLVEALRDQIDLLNTEVEAWREEARRKDHLLAAALERIPAIEAPPDTQASTEPRESPVTASEDGSGSQESPAR